MCLNGSASSFRNFDKNVNSIRKGGFCFQGRNLYSDGTFQNVQKNQNISEIECKNLLPDKIKQFQKT